MTTVHITEPCTQCSVRTRIYSFVSELENVWLFLIATLEAVLSHFHTAVQSWRQVGADAILRFKKVTALFVHSSTSLLMLARCGGRGFSKQFNHLKDVLTDYTCSLSLFPLCLRHHFIYTMNLYC